MRICFSLLLDGRVVLCGRCTLYAVLHRIYRRVISQNPVHSRPIGRRRRGCPRTGWQRADTPGRVLLRPQPCGGDSPVSDWNRSALHFSVSLEQGRGLCSFYPNLHYFYNTQAKLSGIYLASFCTTG